MRTLLSVKWGVKVTCYAGDFIRANVLSERVVKVSTEQPLYLQTRTGMGLR